MFVLNHACIVCLYCFTSDIFHKKVCLPKLLQRRQQNYCDDDECFSGEKEEKTSLCDNNCNAECCTDE